MKKTFLVLFAFGFGLALPNAAVGQIYTRPTYSSPIAISRDDQLVWVVNPAERNALVYRTPEADRLLRVTDALDGEDVLPGFRLPLAELFAELSFE